MKWLTANNNVIAAYKFESEDKILSNDSDFIILI
jgi:hypothetical protein